MSDNSQTKISFDIIGVLLVVFIVLKLCGVIAWSWWWVLSPLWIPLVLVVTLLTIYLTTIVVIAAVGGRS